MQRWIFERLAHATLFNLPVRGSLGVAWRAKFGCELPEEIYKHFALRAETRPRREEVIAALRKEAMVSGLFEPVTIMMELDRILSEAMEKRVIRVATYRTLVDGKWNEVGTPIVNFDSATATAALREKGLLLERLGILKHYASNDDSGASEPETPLSEEGR